MVFCFSSFLPFFLASFRYFIFVFDEISPLDELEVWRLEKGEELKILRGK